ncbi:MAG: MFS transporter [Candidatus Vogelbacteria bacterium]|nr:MFS transporter [Candidatus Vogelbacteria bacterium]
MESEKRFLHVDPDVLKLGLVSFFTDISSEAIFSVFSIFFTVVLGASASLLGLVEGFSDFAASSLDYIAGWLSDKSGKRKSLALAGYGFSTLAKFFLLFGASISSVAMFRIVERLGKSFRGPPRDAWLASVASESNRGYAFGLHKALDKSGAILGPLVAYFLLSSFGQDLNTFHLIFVLAVFGAMVAVLLLVIMKDRPGIPHEKEDMFKAWRTLSPRFKLFLIPAGIFSLAYFSFSFLLLKAYLVGFAIKDVVLLYSLFNISFVVMSVPVGKLGDIIGRKSIVILGYTTYILMCVGFVFATQKWQIIALFLLFGLFYTIDEAQGKAFIADIEKDRRATAIGLYNFLTGIVYLFASVIAGTLWVINPSYSFIFAAVVAAVAMGAFLSIFELNISYKT